MWNYHTTEDYIKGQWKLARWFLYCGAFIIGFTFSRILFGYEAFSFSVANCITILLTLAIVYFSWIESNWINYRAFEFIESHQPKITFWAKDYRDIYIENYGLTPLFNIKLEAEMVSHKDTQPPKYNEIPILLPKSQETRKNPGWALVR